MNKNVITKNKINEVKLKLEYITRYLGKSKIKKSFSKNEADKINKIYVINLDRAPQRMEDLLNELDRLKIGEEMNLADLTTRFQAIDGKKDKLETEGNVIPFYHLSDQLAVEPIKDFNLDNRDYKIKMSKQEVAVALSHIGVWKQMLEDEIDYALILEDDVYFDRKFNKQMDQIWDKAKTTDFDILFLSYGLVKGVNIEDIKKQDIIFKPDFGIWQASGYVLSKKGLQKLIDMLPLYGPVDLWFNLKFDELNAYMIKEPLIKQRNDFTSSNAYSIMPVLESLGLFNYTLPYTLKSKEELPLIHAYGKEGMNALTEALNMLGYSCISDVNIKSDFFNAYVNPCEFNVEYLKKQKNLKVIVTDKKMFKEAKKAGLNVLYLNNKWEPLVEFIKTDKPHTEYPAIIDKETSEVEIITDAYPNTTKQTWDDLPWINNDPNFHGYRICRNHEFNKMYLNNLNDELIYKREDTFAGNLAIFKEDNVKIENDKLELTLQKEDNEIKEYSAGAIGLKEKTLYGKYSVIIKPNDVSGIITGVFLYRSNPHQEIDIEFLGQNHYGFLTNVFYNPGSEGTNLEYGTRGTPVWVNLDFDVTKEYHKYEIEWAENYIIWSVDDKEVYRRDMWNPTPIPNLPMEFNINIWNSVSKELVGELEEEKLPAKAKIKNLTIKSNNN